VFDSLSYPTLIMKPDKTILTANQIFLQRNMVKMDQVVGKSCQEVFYGENICPNEACPFQKVLIDKVGQSVLRRTTIITGKRVWEDRFFSPILDDQGNVAFIMESVRDVTRLKMLEITLKETEAFLEKVIYSSPVAIVAADRYSNLLMLNPAAEDLFGYSHGEAISKISVEHLYPPGVAAEIFQRLKDKSTGGEGKLLSTKTAIINSSGEEIPVELNASIIYEDGEEVATVGIYTDLREKIAVEKKLKETLAQMVQSDKMASIGKLAAGVAHEINNPLTGIMLYANLALDRFAKEDPHRNELEYVLEDANRCKQIVENLLVYSRQTSPMKKAFHINHFIEESLALIRDHKLFLDIDLIKEFSSDEMYIHSDKNQLSQVIINLVLNAVDAMEEKGNLILRTYRKLNSDKICIEISDSGCGIPEDNIHKIFDPFFTTKALGEGTGLGLSTVYGIIKENNGDVCVKETSPTGTTFLITLPECKEIL